jgi:hypothetical protein
MLIVLEVVGSWILLNFAFGPIIAWTFFYPERCAGALQAARDRWIVTHPMTPLEMMPAWLRWEDTTGDDMRSLTTSLS